MSLVSCPARARLLAFLHVRGWGQRMPILNSLIPRPSGIATPGPARARARATSFWARAIIVSSQGHCMSTWRGGG